MFAADETTSHNDPGACPACGHNDCWLGCGEADTDDVDVPAVVAGVDVVGVVRRVRRDRDGLLELARFDFGQIQNVIEQPKQ